MKPQTKAVASFLMRRGKITPRDAFRMGCTRLASRIYELRHWHGFAIDKHMRQVRTRDGSTRIAEYILLG